MIFSKNLLVHSRINLFVMLMDQKVCEDEVRKKMASGSSRLLIRKGAVSSEIVTWQERRIITLVGSS